MYPQRTPINTDQSLRGSHSFIRRNFTMSQTVSLIALLIILYNSISVEGLDCISCQDVVDERLCTSTQTCSQGQSCYKMSHEVNNTLVITEGCIDNKQCGVDVVSIIGRGVSYFGRRQSQTCKECCASDHCNRDLCRHTKPSACLDDETVDCPKMNSIFNICNDIQHAKNVCPNFCGLCSVVDGQWSSWSDWTQCTITCNNGTITRDRTCSNPAPSSGGLNCTGESHQTNECFTATPCPVDGNWSDWGQWEKCSTSCEAGIQTRARTCTNPKPDNQGHHCFGPNLDAILCDNGPCRDGGWSAWSAWSNCRSHFGTGIKTQSRTCTNPKPSAHGSYCIGEPMRVELCYAYTDCSDIKEKAPDALDGVYTVSLWKTHRLFRVYCDMTTDGGGWTVFQQRLNGAVDFYRNFTEYENGFGVLNTEFWLGLGTIQEMSSNNLNELRIDLTAKDGTTAFEVLENFSLSPGPNYTLHVGNTSKSHNIIVGSRVWFGPYHNGMAFSTFDRDMDRGGRNCASSFHGAWWYNNCYMASLNGEYITPGIVNDSGIMYKSFIVGITLKQSKMSFRRTIT